MVLAEQTQVETIALTPAAADAVQDLLNKRELEGYALRVFIKGVAAQVINMVWPLIITSEMKISSPIATVFK